MDHIYILATVILTVYAQIILKWQSGIIGLFPAENEGRLHFFLAVILNPWIISALGAAFIGMLTWMVALSKFQLSYAYPFYTITFAIVILLGAWLFRETLTLPRLMGVGLIIAGVILANRG